MSSSEQPKNENLCIYNDLMPIKVFKYPDQASKIIWSVNSNNIKIISSQIIELITTHKISIQMALYLIDIYSTIRAKEIKLFSELYQKISNQFSFFYAPRNMRLATLLHYQGFKFEEFYPQMKEDEILNLYPTESPLYYIAWDKVDDFKSRFPNIDIDDVIDDEITPLDCAIKYGSELCFIYLKNLGAQYTKYSEEYAVQGGNKEIFMQMIEDGQSFKKMINTALGYRHFEIAEYLKSNFAQTPDSIAESMYFGNYEIVSHLLSNGEDVNKIYIIGRFFEGRGIGGGREECPLSIAIKANSIEIVQFLVEHGADVNMKLREIFFRIGREIFGREECPLSIAIKANSIEIVQFLVEHGADVNMKLGFGGIIGAEECPLSIAIKFEAKNIITFLAEHGATNF